VNLYGLRGFDAVHLSAATLPEGRSEQYFAVISSFDEKLNDAASAEGFTILAPE